MKFAKKLYIMTGSHGATGAVTAEHNAFGTFAEVSASGLGYSRGHRYFVFISDTVLVFPMTAGNKYDLTGAALSPAHVAVVTAERQGIKVELYGTDFKHRLWESNLCDMIRGKINGFETSQTVESGSQKGTGADRIETKTLSLFPLAESYDDTAIAKVNYYSNIYSTKSGKGSRLEELGGGLLSTRLELEEEEPPVLKAETLAKEPNAETETLKDETAASEEEIPTETVHAETAATETSAVTDRYARFLYGYRDSILSGKNRREEKRERAPEKVEEKQKEAEISYIFAPKREAPPVKTASVEDDDGFVGAPKADSAKAEQTLKETAAIKLNFYERNKQKIDRLFDDGLHDETLEKLLPSSRFVRIDVENSDKYYCVGLVGAPDYICYAVPAAYTPTPPEELDGYCQWLPLDQSAPTGDGYWVIYQDAVTGLGVAEKDFSE